MSKPSKTVKSAILKPELLAPAGGLPAFFAAIEAGADAVYCGLTSFSARAAAKNFTIAEVGQMAAYAHSLGRKLYVALNTLIKESELPELVDTLAGLSATGVDGLIIQDLAVWRLARRHFPELPLHGSTQMTIHNAAGVNQLAAMGFTRAVLARELTLAEIAAIGRESRIELEHFVHGALCFSISGQCFFSSLLTGKSGNRGRCVQPCRRRYQHRDKPGHYFSTSDFCAIDHLPRLLEAGVKSLKIEGRMKSPEYVGRVVAAYRMVLDAPTAERKTALEKAHRELELAFGRETTSGFLTGSLPSGIAAPARAATIGRPLGRVTAVRGRNVLIKLADRLHIGDRIKIMPANDQTGVGLTVLRMSIKGQVSKAANSGEVAVECGAAERVHPGDEVFKVAAEQAYGLDEAVGRKRLAAVAKPTTEVHIELRLTSDRLDLRAQASGLNLAASYPIESSPATTHPLDQPTLAKVFAKTGDLPLVLKSLRARNLPALVIPPSRLNEIRRDFYQRLVEALAKQTEATQHQRREAARAELLAVAVAKSNQPHHLTVTGATAADLHLLAEADITRVALALSPENVRGVAELPRPTPEQLARIIWDIPPLIFPGDWDDFRGAIGRLRAQGYLGFRLNNLGHLGLFPERSGLELLGGPALYAMNSQAGLAWRELGLSEIALPLESDRENLAALLSRDCGVPLSLTIYAPLPLLTSRIPLRGARAGDRFASDQGEELRLAAAAGLTVLASTSDFSLLGHRDGLPAGARLHLDLSHCGALSTRGRAILEAFRRGDSPLPGTTTFNFRRGLE